VDPIAPFNNIRPGLQYIDREEIRLSGVRRVIVTGDIGCTGFYEDSKKILAQILKHETDLFFFLGDLAFTGSDEEFHEIIDFCNRRIKVPIFALCGNHDLPGYEKFLGSSSYALLLDTFVCVFLSNATGYFSDRDITFFETTLNRYTEKNFILFMHAPPPTDIDRSHLLPEEWEKIKKVLARHREKVRHIFCAHIHGFHDYRLDGYPVTISAGGGAAMINELKIPEQKIHHAVAVNLHADGTLSTEVILCSAGEKGCSGSADPLPKGECSG
jgi:3',5'-cyclic AMP phosphodiesterase CpdA